MLCASTNPQHSYAVPQQPLHNNVFPHFYPPNHSHEQTDEDEEEDEDEEDNEDDDDEEGEDRYYGMLREEEN